MSKSIHIVHEVILEQKDQIKAVKESDLHEDGNHNIIEDEDDIHVYSEDDDDYLDDDDYDENGNLIKDDISATAYYDADSNSYVEEKGDISSDYYEKKVV